MFYVCAPTQLPNLQMSDVLKLLFFLSFLSVLNLIV